MRRVSNGTIPFSVGVSLTSHMAHHDVPNVCPLWAAYYLLAVGGRRGWWRVRKKAREMRGTRGQALAALRATGCGSDAECALA